MKKFLEQIAESLTEVEIELLKESFEKLTDVVGEKDVALLEKALTGTIKESVKVKLEEKIEEVSSASESLLEEKGKDLVKEYLEEKVKLDSEYEAHGAKLVEEFNQFKDQLVEEYLEEKEELQGIVLETLDEYLETQINESISEDLLEKIAINETLAPVVGGIQKLFAEHYIEVGSSEEAIVESASEREAELQTRLDESIHKNIEQEKLLEAVAKEKLLEDKCSALTESQVEKVKVMFSESSFESTKDKIDAFIDLIQESVEAPAEIEESMIEDEGAEITESAEDVSEEDETIQSLAEDVEIEDEPAEITESVETPAKRNSFARYA